MMNITEELIAKESLRLIVNKGIGIGRVLFQIPADFLKMNLDDFSEFILSKKLREISGTPIHNKNKCVRYCFNGKCASVVLQKVIDNKRIEIELNVWEKMNLLS